jgi:two-component system chemotaxis sensor kinase CheA
MTDLSLLQDFITEAGEHLEEMEENILRLESDPGNKELLNNIFRNAHTIKGASDYLGLRRIAELSHKLESLLDVMRQGERDVDETVTDILISANDRIVQLVADLECTQSEESEIADVVMRIEQALNRSTSEDVVKNPSSEAKNELEFDGEATGQSESTITPELGAEAGDQTETADDNDNFEVYEEEYDQELFQIFVEQVCEGLTNIRKETCVISEETKLDDLFRKYQSQIENLKSSANYMGYDRLAEIYQGWVGLLEKWRNQITDGTATPVTQFWSQCMQPEINKVVALFKKVEKLNTFLVEPELPEQVVLADSPDREDLQIEEMLELEGLDDFLESDADEPIEAQQDSTAQIEIEYEDADSDLLLDPEEPDQMEEDEVKEGNLNSSLLQDFVAESGEHLEEMEGNILRLESDPENKELLNDIFRNAHTIKGASDYLGIKRIAALSHKLESLLDVLRRGELYVDATVTDVLIAANDRLVQMVNELEQFQCEKSEIADIIDRIERALGTASEEDAPEPQTEELYTISEPDDEENELKAANVEKTSNLEIYDEEYDQELFQIFVEQLSKGLAVIEDQSNRVDNENDFEDNLNGLVEKVKALKSSANYMGYEKIVALYNQLENTLCELHDGEPRIWNEHRSSFYETHVYPVIQQVVQFFPEVLQLQRFNCKKTTVEVGDAAIPVGSTDHDDAASHRPIDKESLSSSVPESLTDESALSADLSVFDTSMEKSQAIDTKQEDEDKHDNELLDKLGQAFDSMMSQDGNDTNGGLDRQIEEVLFSSESASQEGEAESFSHEEDPSQEDDEEFHDQIEDPMEDNNEDEDDFEAQLFAEMAVLESKVKAEQKREEELAKNTSVSSEDPSSKPKGSDTNHSSDATIQKTDTPHSELLKNISEGNNPFRMVEQKPEKSARILKQSIRIDASKIDSLMNQVGELVVNRAFFSQLYHEMKDLQHYLSQNVQLEKKDMKQVKGLTFRLSEATVSLGRVANELQEGVMRIRMLPISQLFNRYPRLVHDLVRESGKQVNLEIRGEDTELDKMVIEQIADPLIHIIRNAVDHGIEMPHERKQIGKPEVGFLRLEAYHESNHVVIEVSDDGKGIDVERVKSKAIEKQLVTAEDIAQLSGKDIYGLIMLPGFSTADQVTHTSGRGVGMDVVKKNVEKLNGTIEIDSKKGVSTRFRIKIPLTLAIIPALLVKVEDKLFTIPLSVVDETIRIFKQDMSTIEGIEVINLREQTIPLLRLSEVFNLRKDPQGDDKFFVVIVSTGVKRIGLVVDALLGQEEVVIKPLEDYLQENSGFSGATILGDGQISLILDVYELIRLCTDKQSKRQMSEVPF